VRGNISIEGGRAPGPPSGYALAKNYINVIECPIISTALRQLNGMFVFGFSFNDIVESYYSVVLCYVLYVLLLFTSK